MSQRAPYVLTFLGSMAVVTAWIIFMYATTFQIDAGIMLSAVMFVIGGLALAHIMVGLKIEPFQFKRLLESLMWTAISAGLIYIVNSTVPFRLDVGVMNTRLFSVLMGVGEECSFRVFLCAFIFKVTNNVWLATGISSASWSIFHIARYGGDTGAFFILFIVGLLLGAVIIYSKMADGVIFAHALINYIATS